MVLLTSIQKEMTVIMMCLSYAGCESARSDHSKERGTCSLEVWPNMTQQMSNGSTFHKYLFSLLKSAVIISNNQSAEMGRGATCCTQGIVAIFLLIYYSSKSMEQ